MTSDAHTVEELSGIVDRLCAPDSALRRMGPSARPGALLPSRKVLVEIIEALRSVLFPGFFGATLDVGDESLRFYIGATLDHVQRLLQEQVQRGFCFTCEEIDPSQCPECKDRAVAPTRAFIARLPEVRRLLAADVRAAYDGDPAAGSPEETILCYPGIQAVVNYRLAHELNNLGVPLLPRMITEHAHSVTGIDIHPGASIGERFFIDHGTGVVVGETCVIGNGVRLFQGVTLGAKSFPLDQDGRPIRGILRHPIVEDDVIIYSGATVLGRITIGRGSIIGGNVWLTQSVPPGSRISQAGVRHAEFGDGAGI
jgi:serine O-acetyltransferase